MTLNKLNLTWSEFLDRPLFERFGGLRMSFLELRRFIVCADRRGPFMLRGLRGEKGLKGTLGGKVSCILSSESESSSACGIRADVLGLRLGVAFERTC